MFFIYSKGSLTLKRGSEDVHGLKVGNKYLTFYNDELKLLKTLIEENCNAESKDRILKNKRYEKIDEFYVNRDGNIIALKGNNGEVFDMTDKGAVNWVVKTFVDRLERKDNDRLNINYPHPYNNPQVYIPNQPYMDPNYQRLTQQQLNPSVMEPVYYQPGFGLNPRPNRRVTGPTVVGPTFQQPDQKLTNDTTEPKYYYLNLGEVELVLEQGYPVRNHLEIKEIKIEDKIHETGKEAKARVVDIFYRYIDELEKDKEEINKLLISITDLLPENEKVELLVSNDDCLNAVIQYEDTESIKNIKIKNHGIETVIYTKPIEPIVFRVNSCYYKDEILKKLQKLVKEHNEKVENSKEF